MDALHSFVALTLRDTHPFPINETKALLENYFQNANGITILSDNPFFWTTLTLTVPIMLKAFTTHFPKDQRQENVLIHISSNTKSTGQFGIRWFAATRFFIIIEDGCDNDMINDLWQAQACHLLVLSFEKNYFEVCVEKDQQCFLENPNLIAKNLDISRELSNLVMRPTLKNCVLNISYLDFPPLALLENGKLFGLEGQPLYYALEKQGVTALYDNKHEDGWGSFDPPTGMYGRIMTGASFAGFIGIFPLQERNHYADLILSDVEVELAVAVPSGAGSAPPLWVVLMFSEFSITVWLCIVVTFLLSIPMYYFVSKISNDYISNDNWPFYVGAILLGYSQRPLKSRLFMLSFILFGFIITTEYKSVQSSKLTAPAKIAEIRTLRELVNSKLTIGTPLSARNLIVTQSDNPDFRGMSDLINVSNGTMLSFLKRIANQRDCAYIRHKSNMLYLVLKNAELMGKIHVVDQELIRFFPAVMIKKRSCFTPLIQKLFYDLAAGGIYSKLRKDMSITREEHDNPIRKLTVHDIIGFIYLLVLGWIVSLFAFLSEHIYVRINKLNEK